MGGATEHGEATEWQGANVWSSKLTGLRGYARHELEGSVESTVSASSVVSVVMHGGSVASRWGVGCSARALMLGLGLVGWVMQWLADASM